MTLSVKHKFTSAKADGTDNTLVKPTNWNAEHDLVTDTDGVILGRPAGAGPGPITDMPLGSLFPTGAVIPYAGNVEPAGWAFCYGQSYSRTAQANLYAAIGTTFGAPDAGSFNAPDLRGVAVVGKTNMGGSDRGNLAGGGVLGNYLGSGANRQPRVYGIVDANSGSAVGFHGTVDSNAPPDTFQTGPGGEHTVCAAFVANTLSVQASGMVYVSGNIRNDGNNVTDPFSVIQPSLVLNYIIKL